MSSTAVILPAARWTPHGGSALVGLVTLFMLTDAVMHLLVPAPVLDAFRRLEFPTALAVPLGVIELICVAAYVWPRSAVLGAILLTGYLGGATAINLRVGDPTFETLFPVIIGALALGRPVPARRQGTRAPSGRCRPGARALRGAGAPPAIGGRFRKPSFDVSMEPGRPGSQPE